MPPIISFFHLSPSIIRDTPGLGEQLRAHGLNTLELLVYRNPRHDKEFPTWKRNYMAEYQPGWEIDWCVREGWDYVGRLDDAVRTEPEQARMLAMPESLAYVASYTQSSGRCVGVEMCDEMRHPSEYPLDAVLSIWHGANGPPIACPSLAPRMYHRIPGLDYLSCEWDWWNRRNYKTRSKAMRNALKELPDDDRPVSLLWPVVAEWYSERDGKPGPTKGDVIWNRGMTVPGLRNLAREAIKIVGRHPLRLRGYGYDFPEWVRDRSEWKPGHRGRLQTGAGPHVDRRRWKDILKVCKEITQGVKV